MCDIMKETFEKQNMLRNTKESNMQSQQNKMLTRTLLTISQRCEKRWLKDWISFILSTLTDELVLSTQTQTGTKSYV